MSMNSFNIFQTADISKEESVWIQMKCTLWKGTDKDFRLKSLSSGENPLFFWKISRVREVCGDPFWNYFVSIEYDSWKKRYQNDLKWKNLYFYPEINCFADVDDSSLKVHQKNNPMSEKDEDTPLGLLS